jgi:hypothetical protein
MLKPIPILIATAAALFGASSLAGGAQIAGVRNHNAVTVVGILGARVSVPPGRFVKAYAYCPKGYYVTGGGAYSGAITEIASSPTPNLRGWFVDGENLSGAKATYHHRAVAVCVKGSPPVTVGAAADTSTLHQAEFEAADSR